MTRAQSIIAAVAEEHGLTVKELLERRRVRRVAWPRQAAMLALHEAGYSTPQIGQFLGGYDHTTVLHGIARAIERRQDAAPYTIGTITGEYTCSL